MDGVLADFERGVRELAGQRSVSQDIMSSDEEDLMWKGIAECGRFYYRLKPVNGSVELFRSLHDKYGDRCEILTGIPKPKRHVPSAGEDKTAWVREYLGEDVKVNICFREDKWKYCLGRGCILIDDYGKNIEEWRAQGGTGILFVSAGKTAEMIRELENS